MKLGIEGGGFYDSILSEKWTATEKCDTAVKIHEFFSLSLTPNPALLLRTPAPIAASRKKGRCVFKVKLVSCLTSSLENFSALVFLSSG